MSAGVRAFSQVVIIYALAALLEVGLSWSPLALLGAALFATFSLIIASCVKTRERLIGIGQLLTMPLFFASNAIYPIAIMPSRSKAIATVNPLTYMADALRTLMLVQGTPVYGLPTDFGVLAAFTVALILIGGHSYANLVR